MCHASQEIILFIDEAQRRVLYPDPTEFLDYLDAHVEANITTENLLNLFA